MASTRGQLCRSLLAARGRLIGTTNAGVRRKSTASVVSPRILGSGVVVANIAIGSVTVVLIAILAQEL